jgi:hypothetical protein
MSNTRYSFTLDRAGVPAGFRVKPRLRWVDTITIVVQVAAVGVGGFFLWVKCLGWARDLGLGRIVPNETVGVLCLVALLLACLYATSFATTTALRLFFLITGMLTPEEARHYPLEASKKRVAPWPECWLEPDPAMQAEYSIIPKVPEKP